MRETQASRSPARATMREGESWPVRRLRRNGARDLDYCRAGLWRCAIERPYPIGNLLAETRDRAAVRGGERVVATLLQRLARAGATRLDFSILGATHRPYGIQQRVCAGRRVEGANADLHAVVRICIQCERKQRDARRAQ